MVWPVCLSGKSTGAPEQRGAPHWHWSLSLLCPTPDNRNMPNFTPPNLYSKPFLMNRLCKNYDNYMSFMS